MARNSVSDVQIYHNPWHPDYKELELTIPIGATVVSYIFDDDLQVTISDAMI